MAKVTMIKKWKTLSSKQVFSHPRHNVFIDEVELPDGSKSDYLHFGKMNDTAMVIAVDNDGKILIQKEYSYPPNEILYQFPGGMLNDGESPEQGALREFGEETGLTGDIKQIGWMYLENRRKSQKMYFFVANNLSAVDNFQKDPQEFFEEFWLTKQEIEKLIKNNKVRNYTALAGWAFYSNLN
ncbi:NUDIX hydrolase [Candidatus Saccharibacteria bacterium]|nr:NUDIX hydrolase [Candidatus Saccharibacteria bacterium]